MSRKLILILVALMAMPTYAVKDFKVSNYGAGVQIWFEAENYDERNPDNDNGFALTDEPGAFGRSITNASGDDGAYMLRYTFDISTAGGSGGTWYFWGRVINANNRSSFMLVEGNPGDPMPVTIPMSGLDNSMRIFEENIGDTWTWARTNHGEAHTKTLRDGENNMYILSREDQGIMDVFMWTNDPSYVPTDDDYINALPGKPSGKALKPDPADGDMISNTWVSATWVPGAFAVSHDVYLGESFDDVNGATVDSPTFQVNLTSNNFIAGLPSFPFPDGLMPGSTYYWRVDAVNPDDPNSPWKGDVWSFWIPPTNAFDPIPADGAKFINLDATLTWQPGLDAKIHSVVFGDNFDDVNNAPTGPAVAGTTFTPAALESNKTYYWRVDELNPPTTVKGKIWSFSTVPDIPITDPTLLCWWKFDEGQGTTAVDYSGHNQHGTLEGDTQWVDGKIGGALAFDGTGDRVVDETAADYLNGLDAITVCMWVKSNVIGTDKGFIDGEDPDGGDNVVTMRYDASGANGGGANVLKMAVTSTAGEQQLESSENAQTDEWQHVAMTWASGQQLQFYINGVLDTPSDNQAATTGTISDCTKLVVGAGAKDASGGWDGLIDDVRIYNKALTADEILLAMRGDLRLAWAPVPANSSLVGIDVASSLSWSPGDGASQHDVYFGTDRAVVTDSDASDTTGVYKGRQSTTSYAPEGVTMDSGPYYWRIDEVANDGTINKGSVWNFTVSDYILIDDFESYNDITAGEPGSNLVYIAWVDGFDNPNVNGSTMGYVTGASMETGNVHGGNQSVPFQYNNATAGVSEVTRTFTPAQDWTAHGVITLSLWFAGNAANVSGQLYVKVNGVQVNYDSDATNLSRGAWQVWNIDLTAIGTNLTSVRNLAIGVQGAGATGTLLLDDIRLYPYPRKLVSPVAPDPAGLVTHYTLDGNVSDSVGTANGTLVGGQYAPGKFGQAVSLSVNDYVDCGNPPQLDFGTGAWTISAWVNAPSSTDQMNVFGKGGDNTGGIRYVLSVGETNDHVVVLTLDDNATKVQKTGSIFVDDGQWHHIVGIRDESGLRVYVDGSQDGAAVALSPTYDLSGTSQANAYIGAGWNFDTSVVQKFFTGMIDEVRVYNYALSSAEVLYLAGVTLPYDEPF